MDVKENDLTKEELDFLIEKLSGEDDEEDAENNNSESSMLNQTETQADLKIRIQRGVDELRARNEDVHPNLLRLIERL